LDLLDLEALMELVEDDGSIWWPLEGYYCNDLSDDRQVGLDDLQALGSIILQHGGCPYIVPCPGTHPSPSAEPSDRIGFEVDPDN